MKITHIEVTASRTFNHPTERYANFRFAVKLTGESTYGDAQNAEILELRQMAEQIAETHKQEILQDIANADRRRELNLALYRAAAAPPQIAKLEDQLAAELANEAPAYSVEYTESQITRLKELLASVPALEAELAALPAPRLLPLKEIHPGHPDHPETDDDSGY